MSAVPAHETEPALQGYIDKWLAVQPQQRVALVFVNPQRYPGHVALAALEQELLSAAYGIREPQVAAAKLGWWAEELVGAAASGGRHPLTRALFAQDRARLVDSTLWLAPVRAALAQLERGTATDFQAQLEAAAPFHGALAALETAWWYGHASVSARAGRVAALNHLLFALLRLESDIDRDRLPLPMARLARYGLNREQLRGASAPRQEAIRAQLDDLVTCWRESTHMQGPLSVFRSIESEVGRASAERALRSSDALASLHHVASRAGWRTTWQAWRAAKVWQHR